MSWCEIGAMEWHCRGHSTGGRPEWRGEKRERGTGATANRGQGVRVTQRRAAVWAMVLRVRHLHCLVVTVRVEPSCRRWR